MLINLIDTDNKFRKALSELKKTNYVSIDTESDGLYHYEESLCLMQIEANSVVYIIDTLNLNIEMIRDIFEDEKIEKIFHSASSDISLIKKHINFEINNIFDTMIASKYLFKKAYSLRDLIKKYFNIDINKRYQKINWAKRPLVYEYLEYAANDVYYLKMIRDKLFMELEKKGFYEQFKRYCERIAKIDPRKKEFKLNRYLSIADRYGLNDFQKALFIELLKKRESIAKFKNLPPFKIISNDKLIYIIKNRDINRIFLPEWINDIISTFKYYDAKQNICFPRKDLDCLDSGYRERIKILKIWRNKKSEDDGISHELILSKAEIKKIAEYMEIDVNILKKCGIDDERITRYGDDLISYYNKTIKKL